MSLGIHCVFCYPAGTVMISAMVQTLLEPFDLMEKLILADKGYDSNQFVCWVQQQGGIVVIPSRMTAKLP